jgi:aspartate/methionine/tyrosine aminotransferase
MGAFADAAATDYLRLENLDVNIPPEPEAIACAKQAAESISASSYLPFIGQQRLRDVAAKHVSSLSGVSYSGHENCVITAGGLSGILNVLLATVEVGDEVIVTDPTYAGLINRIRLTGGIPRFVPFCFTPGAEWKLDREALRAAVHGNTKLRAMLLMSPSMPTGGYFDADDWKLIAELCIETDLLLILDAAMERLVYDGREVIHPAGLPGMAERTITVGSASKELRMIGWRVGWVVAPRTLIPDLFAVSLANGCVPVGIAQNAAAVALELSQTRMKGYVDELEQRRNLVLKELNGLAVGVPGGGWSLLLRVSDFGLDGATASAKLLEHGVCATAMEGWGSERASQYVRFVYSNETLDRLEGLGVRVRKALGLV